MAPEPARELGQEMRSLPHLRTRSVVRPAVVVALASLLLPVAATPGSAATTKLDTETYRVQPSNKLLRFQLLLKDDGVAVLTFAVRKKGRFKVLDREVVNATFVEGSTDADVLDVTQDYDGAPKNGGQGLIAWEGPTDEEDHAEYFGFDLKTGELDLYGG